MKNLVYLKSAENIHCNHNCHPQSPHVKVSSEEPLYSASRVYLIRTVEVSRQRENQRLYPRPGGQMCKILNMYMQQKVTYMLSALYSITHAVRRVT